jgi:hypothetical protein
MVCMLSRRSGYFVGALVEEALAGPEHDGEHDQTQFIDQVVLDQRNWAAGSANSAASRSVSYRRYRHRTHAELSGRLEVVG